MIGLIWPGNLTQVYPYEADVLTTRHAPDEPLEKLGDSRNIQNS